MLFVYDEELDLLAVGACTLEADVDPEGFGGLGGLERVAVISLLF